MLLVPVRAEDGLLLLSSCKHGANNPCINPAEGPAFRHRAVIVKRTSKAPCQPWLGQGARGPLGAGTGKNLLPATDVTWKQTPEGQRNPGVCWGAAGGLLLMGMMGLVSLPEGSVRGYKGSLAS